MTAGCGASFAPSAVRTDSERTAVAPEGPRQYKDVAFARLIQPAFAADYDGQGVAVEVAFYGVQAVVLDLPKEFRDHIRLQVCSGTGPGSLGGTSVLTCENMYTNVVVPKEKSDPVFALKQGQRVRIKAVAINSALASAVSGRGQASLILRVDEITAIGI